MPIEPFELPYSESAVSDLRERLRRTRWLDEVPGAAWEYGFDLSFLQDLCAYWLEEFDWKAQLVRLSAFHHYRFTPAGKAGVHLIHERGNGPAPLPLIVTHGWRSSVAANAMVRRRVIAQASIAAVTGQRAWPADEPHR